MVWTLFAWIHSPKHVAASVLLQNNAFAVPFQSAMLFQTLGLIENFSNLILCCYTPLNIYYQALEFTIHTPTHAHLYH